MRDIVEEVLGTEGERRPPGLVRDVRVAVVGIGPAGTGRLPGIGRRLRDESFVGQMPTDIDAVTVDLPGDESTVDGWDPAARHTIERLDRGHRTDRVRLGPEATRRLRRFGGDGLGEYDALVVALDGTDPAAVSVSGDLAAAFRGGIASPVVAVPTFPAESPPETLLGDEDGWLSEARADFGPDAVVPIEHGRAAELAGSPAAPGDDTTRRPDGEPAEAPPRSPGSRDGSVERAATDVTAALAEALGTRAQFGSLADDLHHLRGRMTVHVGRVEGRDVDAESLVADALATPLSSTPGAWDPGGAWLAHLRSTSPEDDDIEAVMTGVRSSLAGRTGVGLAERPAELRSYRLAATDPHELFLFRTERPGEPDREPLPCVEGADVSFDEAFEVDDEAGGDGSATGLGSGDGDDGDSGDGGLDVIR
jgi:hypothetical protein